MSHPPGPDPYMQRPYSAEPYSAVPYQQPYQQAPVVPVSYPYPSWAGAPFGVDPLTGQPLSDKSKATAGLLQLLPGLMLGLGGIGRLYAGHTALGVVQLVMSFVGWLSFFCGFLLILPFAVTLGVWLWFVVDGIVLLSGRPVDGYGRPLRS